LWPADGWQFQTFEERPPRARDPPARLQKWLERHGIKTKEAVLPNLLAYEGADKETLVWETPVEKIAQRFSELVCRIAEALRGV
jgi:hypothetical protein